MATTAILDATHWRSARDLCENLMPILGLSGWMTIDHVWSLLTDDEGVPMPDAYEIRIENLRLATPEAQEAVERMDRHLREFRAAGGAIVLTADSPF